MWARTLWPLLSSTRNIAFGRASTTVPSISITPSFFGMSSAICCWLIYRVAPEPLVSAEWTSYDPFGRPFPDVTQRPGRSHCVRRAAAGHHETGPRWADVQLYGKVPLRPNRSGGRSGAASGANEVDESYLDAAGQGPVDHHVGAAGEAGSRAGKEDDGRGHLLR